LRFLEAEGWSVWWDKSLAAADKYRDEIMKQLAAARAVISIWTPTSIKSDWVRAEAGRAEADGKLIPVKTAEGLMSQLGPQRRFERKSRTSAYPPVTDILLQGIK
jgi:hypothetical protein